MGRNVEVRWLTGNTAGYVDVLPVALFSSTLLRIESTHLVRGPFGGKHTARFRLTVKRLDAEMDYRAFPEYNERHGMERGVMALRFVDSKRLCVPSLWWNGKRVSSSRAHVSVVQSREPSSPGELAVRAQRANANVFLRPGQLEFRRRLDVVYGAKCCISGCTIPWAVEAAHIEAYSDGHSNVPSNGLLLRRDLHTLFDVDHLAVHPKSRKVFFSSEARGWAGYDDLHGKAVLASPQPGQENYGPDLAALCKRWERFKNQDRPK